MRSFYWFSLLVVTVLCVACQPLALIDTGSSSAQASISNSGSARAKPSATPTIPRFTATPLNFIATIPPLPTMTATATPEITPIHVMRVDYKDYDPSDAEANYYEQQMKAANINMVALSGGRVEWTYFIWPGHQANESNPVKDSGTDYLMRDALRFGKWAKIDAVVDILAPNYIKAHPDKAAISYYGKRSEYLVSTNELVNGEFGRMVLDMVTYMAKNYPIDSISITELIYHSDGYGADDKKLYLAYSGRKDWPRKADGTINIDDKSIGDWRTHALDVYLDKLAAVVHLYHKQFYLDVGLSVDNLTDETNSHGTNYQVVLQHTDKIVIWGYYDLDEYDPSYFVKIGQFLQQFGMGRVIMSLGLWDEKYPVSPADKFAKALQAVQDGGVYNIWITPGSLMTPDHWKVLQEMWAHP